MSSENQSTLNRHRFYVNNAPGCKVCHDEFHGIHLEPTTLIYSRAWYSLRWLET